MPPEGIVLVHHMGRVGANLVHAALGQHPGLGPGRVLLTHAISEEAVALRAWSAGRHEAHESPGLRRSRDARRWLDDPSRAIDVIAPVSEPIARNVANFLASRPGAGPDALRDRFATEADHWTPLRWFDDEVRVPLGIDVFQTPFDHERGARAYEAGRIRLLVLRSDLPPRAHADAVAEFLGITPFRYPPDASDTWVDTPAYRDAARAGRLPSSYADWLHAGRYAAHFFTAAELEAARASWTGRHGGAHGRGAWSRASSEAERTQQPLP